MLACTAWKGRDVTSVIQGGQRVLEQQQRTAAKKGYSPGNQWCRWPAKAMGVHRRKGCQTFLGCELLSAGPFIRSLYLHSVINTAPDMSVGAQEMVSKWDQRRPHVERDQRTLDQVRSWVITEGPGCRFYQDPNALREFSICHLYTNVIFYVWFMSQFFVQNIFWGHTKQEIYNFLYIFKNLSF